MSNDDFSRLERFVKPMFCDSIQKCHRGGHCGMCDKGNDAVIDRLRGQLQNCVDHLHMMKRKVHPTRSEALSLDKVIEQANQALYETLDFGK